MTNYNDGLWHGWNGGECPVHPETVVKIQRRDESRNQADEDDTNRAASDWDWSIDDVDGDIVAFRVIKEHKEPREFWAREMVNLRIPGGTSDPYWQECSPTATGAILFREVLA